MKKAFVFPGQGAQFVGMGKDLYENSPEAKELFENELMEKTDAYKNGNIVYLDPSIWYTATGGFTSTMKMVEEINSAIK